MLRVRKKGREVNFHLEKRSRRKINFSVGETASYHRSHPQRRQGGQKKNFFPFKAYALKP